MNDIIIYPSSWYYNACVQGFLEILAWGLGEEGERIVEEDILKRDGRAVIPGDLAEAVFSPSSVPMPAGYSERPVPPGLESMKRIAWWWVEAGYEAGFVRKEDRGKNMGPLELIETVTRSLFHTKSGAYYPNLMQLTWGTNKKIDFLNRWFELESKGAAGTLHCSFCGDRYIPDTDARIYDLFFTRSLFIDLGSSPDAFPNLFWSGKPNLTMCKKCRSYLMCFHLVHHNRFFFNSDSLLVNWYVNRLLTRKIEQGGVGYQKSFINSLQYDSQLRKGVSGWGIQSFEMLVFERNKINYYPISDRLAKMFLMPRISMCLSKISNARVWDMILKENFSYLPTIIYKSLHGYLSQDFTSDDPEFIREVSNGVEPVVNLIELCYEINRHLLLEKGGKGMAYINVREIRNLAANAPLSQDDNIVFRLLELTRLNRKNDVYHLLLRLYVARGIRFPEELSNLFSASDDLFKIGMYAYISGLESKKQEKGIEVRVD